MSSPKYNKTKGATFEVDIVKLFRKLGHLAERLRLAGKDDEGDIAAVIAGKTYILELKNVKKIDLPQFWKEAEVEAKNYAKARGLEVTPFAFVIVKRRNAPIEKSWVVQPLDQWLKEKDVS